MIVRAAAPLGVIKAANVRAVTGAAKVPIFSNANFCTLGCTLSADWCGSSAGKDKDSSCNLILLM
jgi:hypothetical protein